MIEVMKVIKPVMSKIFAKLSEKLVHELLFKGRIRAEYTSKAALNGITERYKESITDVNRSLGLNISFTALALYVYFILPTTESVEISYVGITVSRQNWISIAPIISYVLQLLILTSFIWFLALRLGSKLLVKESVQGLREEELEKSKGTLPSKKLMNYAPESEEVPEQSSSIPDKLPKDLADLTDIHLKGTLGHLWMILRLRGVFSSWLHLFWYVPALVLVLAVVLSPILISLFFIIQIFNVGMFWLGLAYSILLIPYSALLVFLIATVAMLGLGEVK